MKTYTYIWTNGTKKGEYLIFQESFKKEWSASVELVTIAANKDAASSDFQESFCYKACK